MANLKVGTTNIGKIALVEPYEDIYFDNEAASATSWVRPSGWLNMPSIGLDEHKCVFLFAVPSGEDNPQRFARFFARGPYTGWNQYKTDITFDWGDGSSNTVNQTSSPPAQIKEYDFDSLPVETQLEIDGRPYRQTLITISANSGIRDVNWRYYTNFAGGSRSAPSVNILEYNINAPSGSYFGDNPSNSTGHRLPLLEKARVYAPQATSFNSLFQNTEKLKSLDLYSGAMPNLTQARYMFANCGIESLPDLDTSNVSYFTGMMQSVKNIKEFPSGKYDMSNVHPTGLISFFSYSKFEKIHIDIPSNITKLQSVFYNCHNLKSVKGNWDTSNVYSFHRISENNVKLRSIPEVDFTSAQDMYRAFMNNYEIRNEFYIKASGCYNWESSFSSCRSIEKITIADMSNYRNLSVRYDSVFSSCHKLKKVEVINPRVYTSHSYGVQSMFNSCLSLEYVPYLDFSGVKSFSSMFSSCCKLKKIADINTPDGTNFYRMFYYCRSLNEIPNIDITCRGTGNVSIRQIFDSTAISEVPNYDFSRCYSMEGWKAGTPIQSGSISLDLSNMISSVSTYAYNGSLSLHPISEITNLVIGSGANMQSSFSSMHYLKSVPFVDASNGYTYAGLFNYCSNLEVGALSGTDANIGYYRTGLGSGAVLDVFNNLASGVTGKTIDMRQTAGVYMLSSQEQAIPSSKGWTLLT